tara:strand:- start:138 stop:635 length:498 start_codon:yes stop_codon:yes gene_type:complete
MKWTPKDIEKLKKLWNEGKTLKEISKKFSKRANSSVTNKVYKLQAAGEIRPRHKDSKYYNQHPMKQMQFAEVPMAEPELDGSATLITKTVGELLNFLLEKNEQYGDSALEPIRIFSKASIDEQIKVRIDDKLNRLIQGSASIEKDEDVIKDLIGYLVLLLIHLRN